MTDVTQIKTVAHELKSWPEFFEEVFNGMKKFEIRNNDRNFIVGERVLLKEWEPCRACDGTGLCSSGDENCGACAGKGTVKGYTGRELSVKILYIVKGHPGLKDGYVVFGITDVWKKK
jgi:hypothetical protein